MFSKSLSLPEDHADEYSSKIRSRPRRKCRKLESCKNLWPMVFLVVAVLLLLFEATKLWRFTTSVFDKKHGVKVKKDFNNVSVGNLNKLDAP
nr:hypothetical protein [Tanacetum cinerariifolium]